MSVGRVAVNLKVAPEPGIGGLRLYREDGTLLAFTTYSTTQYVDVGTRGYFVAMEGPGILSKITVNGATYTSTKTPVITFDKDTTAVAYFELIITPPGGLPPPEERVKLSIIMEGYGSVALYKPDGTLVMTFSGNETTVVRKGMQGYFVATPRTAAGYQFDRLIINDKTYTTPTTPVFTFDTDYTVIVYFKTAVTPPPPTPTPPVTGPPNLKIENLSYPSVASPGEAVTISWYIHNAGGTIGGPQWTRLVDLDTGRELYRGEISLNTCERAGPATFKGTMPNKSWLLMVEAGYGSTITSSIKFIIGVSPPPAPAKVTIMMSVSPALVGSLSLFDETGKKIASTTQAQSVTVDKGMRGYFKAEAFEGYMVQQITVNGSAYMAAQTPVITFDRDMIVTAAFAKKVAPPAPPTPVPAPVPAPPTAPPPGVFYPMIPQIIPPEFVAWGQQAISTLQQTYYGLPLWAWIAIGAGGAAAIGVAAYYKLRG
jgi:hypothetical protein